MGYLQPPSLKSYYEAISNKAFQRMRIVQVSAKGFGMASGLIKAGPFDPFLDEVRSKDLCFNHQRPVLQPTQIATHGKRIVSSSLSSRDRTG